ncbi:hypothetical protein [Bacteroides sp. 51]|uniref:hypothetical protein n=1 Tax=Bacteroides sp. 51 TaxID=2302938 RepID=UPI0013D0B61C|nr:hypothetical protein [Bacteroides sp. 51]NDV83534.1 hypothetical protein [Bacteroides sp. 51]
MNEFQLILETKKLELKQYMTDLYPEGLPGNSIVNKVLTGIRATTCELDAKRHSIIIVPNVPVIDGKQVKHPKILGVRAGIKEPEIIPYLNDKKIKYKKILVTPESYWRVKNAVQNTKFNLFTDFFFMIDECEKLVQEAFFRKEIIEPFFDFFEYENKCMISATPLYPNLKGFVNHNFKLITIKPTYPYQKDLSLIGTNNVSEEVVKHIQNRKGKLAVFLNSLEYAEQIIEKAGIKEICKIYTSTDEVPKLTKAGYKAADTFACGEELEDVMIFTSRFYSAVDIDMTEKPDVLMVTNCIYKRQTMIDPFTHAVQIPGRFRAGFGNITHITNSNPNIEVRTREELSNEIIEAKAFYDEISKLDSTSTSGAQLLLRCIEEESILSKFIFKTGKYKGQLNPFLVECYLQQKRIEGLYSELRLLQKGYRETGHFNVSYEYMKYEECEKNKTTKLTRGRKIEILYMIKTLLPDKTSMGLNLFLRTEKAEAKLEALQQEAPVFYDFYKEFGSDAIIELDYDLRKMKSELKPVYNKKQYLIPKAEVQESFTLKVKYSEKVIKDTLQRIYDKYELKDYDGKPLVAEAKDLKHYFEISNRISIPKSREKGYMPLEKLI